MLRNTFSDRTHCICTATARILIPAELLCGFLTGTGTYTNFEGSSNIFYLKASEDGGVKEMVWYTSAVVIVYNPESHTQRFFMGHDDDVTALDVHPNGVICASGQVAKDPVILIWDSGAAEHEDTAEDAPDDYPWGPQILKKLHGHDGQKVHVRGIKSLEFSPDGKLLCSVGEGDTHNVAIWDWRNNHEGCEDGGILLARARGHNAPVFACRFNPYQYLGLPSEDPQPGEARVLDDTCYTLVSCGDRHIKFWVFHRVPDREAGAAPPPAADDGAGAGAGAGGKKGKKKTEAAPKTADTGKMWRLECQQGSIGTLGELQTFNCLAFVDDAPPLKGADDGANDHTAGRVVAGTAKGDIYIFVQPRKPPSDWDDADAYVDAVDAALEDGEPLKKWWEADDPDDEDEPCERVAWLPEAKLVHNVPRSVRAGNQCCLPKAQREALVKVQQQLKARPKDAALLSDQRMLGYGGPLAHARGVHALAFKPGDGEDEPPQLMSAGGDGKVAVWAIGMPERYAVAGVDGAERDSDGAHSLARVPGKEVDLRTDRPMRDLKDVNKGTEAPIGTRHPTTTAKSLHWDAEENGLVAIGTNCNCILQMDAREDTMHFDVLVTAHTGCVHGVGYHPQDGNLFCTCAEDRTLRIWHVRKSLQKGCNASTVPASQKYGRGG